MDRKMNHLLRSIGRNYSILLLSLLPFFALSQAPKTNKYGLAVINSVKAYQQQVQKDKNQKLVNLAAYIPGLVLDIRYATANNFMHEPVYKSAKAYLRKPVADALQNVQKELNKKGLGLKIYDAYRPYSVTVYFFEKLRDTVYLAHPAEGSRHNRGCTVDLTLVDLKTGQELAMPTPYDDFTKKAHANYAPLPQAIKRNRELLKTVMAKHGFRVYNEEWWHYDFKNYKQFPLMDIPFESLPE